MIRILLTSGDFDNYGHHGVYEVPSVEWIRERLDRWLDRYPEERAAFAFRLDAFIAHLETVGMCKLAVAEVWLGSDHTAELEEIKRPGEEDQ